MRGEPVELLPDFESLLRWLADAHLVDARVAARCRTEHLGSPAAARLLAEAHALRRNLRGIVERICAGQAPTRSSLAVLNRALRRGVSHTELVYAAGRFMRRKAGASNDLESLLFPIAEAAASLLCSFDAALVRRCDNPDCVLYFYDTSKNRARRWCSMELCGNRMKVAAHYARKRTEERETRS